MDIQAKISIVGIILMVLFGVAGMIFFDINNRISRILEYTCYSIFFLLMTINLIFLIINI